MNKNENEFSDLGEQFKSLITNAVGNQEYGQLSKQMSNIGKVAVEEVLSGVRESVKQTSDSIKQTSDTIKQMKNTKKSTTFSYGWTSHTVNHTTTTYQQSVKGTRPQYNYTGEVIDTIKKKKNNLGFSKQQESLFPVDKKALKGGIGIAFEVVGIVFSILNLLTALILGGLFGLSALIPTLLVSFGFVGLFFRGKFIVKRKKRFQTYLSHMEKRKFIEIKELAQRTRQTVDYTANDLKKMIGIGVFPDAHIDDAKEYFLGDYEIYRQYLETQESARRQQITVEAERREIEAMPREVLEAAKQGKIFMEGIRDANELIPGEEISRKLDDLELVTSKIFERIQEKPELLGNIRKFMEYYLPTTEKLVNAYKEFDLQPIQGEKIRKSKEDIEATIDTINIAFLNLYNSLFENDVMDVNADISVLHAMFAQEGLTKKDFSLGEGGK